jgi:penicillin-binding protein 1A
VTDDQPGLADLRRRARRHQRQVRREEGHRRRRARRSFLWRHRRAFYLMVLVLLATVTGAGAVLSRIPLPEDDAPPQTSYLCAADVAEECGPDNALASFAAEQDRYLVDFDDVPSVLVDAVVAAEDRDFFSHSGLDPTGVARAVWHDLRGRAVLQGGSTITQQYVKNAFLTPQRSFVRKLREAVLAVKLERQLSKEEILERYLNTIYFGRGAYGVAAAARAYFGHDLTRMDLHEAAYLAALIRAPETADVFYGADRAEATFRLQTVLDAMVDEGMVPPEAAAAAAAVPFERYVVGRQERTGQSPVRNDGECGTRYFVDHVRQTLLADPRFGAGIFTKGLRIYTSLDPTRQCLAWRTLYQDTLVDAANDPAASLVSVDQLGRVVAMVGGRDYAVSQVNLALGRQGGGSGRQAGSAFKPFALAAAVQAGISPLSRFPAPDKVVVPEGDNGADWVVSNYADGGRSAALDLLDATKDSSNTVYAQLMTTVGAQRVADLARQMGVTADLPAVPALVLGTAEVSVLDMASAFSTLANRGWHVTPQSIVRIEDAEGHTVWEPAIDSRPVLREQEADQVTAALRGVIGDGTGTNAAIHLDAAGKTGTTEDARDAWFVGYTCNLTTAVWMGFTGREGQVVAPMKGILGLKEVTGGSLPASMWSAYMDAATDSVQDCDLTPTGVEYSGRVLNGDLATGAVQPSAPAEPVTPPDGTTTSSPTTAAGGQPTATSSGSPSASAVGPSGPPDATGTPETTVPTPTSEPSASPAPSLAPPSGTPDGSGSG